MMFALLLCFRCSFFLSRARKREYKSKDTLVDLLKQMSSTNIYTDIYINITLVVNV